MAGRTEPATDAPPLEALEDVAPVEESGATPAQTTTEGILPADHWMQAPPNEEINDDDSALAGLPSSTASLTSSILKYRTLYGRTYHSERGNARHWSANDDLHLDAMDVAHHAFTLALDGKLCLAPVEDKKLEQVLDIGTGTGLWAIDFADAHPETSVIGTDISPTQPTWVPPNLRFEIEDCTQNWTFTPNSFNYIHIRFLIGSIDNWETLMQRAFDACKPGGYVESMEPSAYLESDDGTVTDDMAMGQWGKLFVEASRRFGRSFELYQQGTVRAALEKAGFEDIHEINLKTPMGGWAKDPKLKELGEYTRLSLMTDPEGYMLFLASALGWKREEITVYLAHLKRELKNRQVHGYYRQKVIWAKKPEA